LETKICRAKRPIWRGKPSELPDLFGEENLELPDLFGDENLQSYQTYLERKTSRATRPFGEENLQSYQAYLETKIYRATGLIWRRTPAELQDLFAEDNIEGY